MNRKILRMVLPVLVFAVLALPTVAGAAAPTQQPTCDPAKELCNPLPASDIPTLLGNVLRALFGVLGSIALLMFIYGGFMWLTSGGVPEKIKKGQDTMVWAVLGIAVTFAAYTIVGFVITAITTGA